MAKKIVQFSQVREENGVMVELKTQNINHTARGVQLVLFTTNT